MENEGLWSFANRFYTLPGVSDACLKLQDEHGVDVCTLMLLLWLAHKHRAVRATQVQMMLRSVAAWRERVVLPLRSVRRWLKAPPVAVDSEGAQTLRGMIKSAELRAERLQLEALESLFGPSRLCLESPDVLSAVRINLQAYATALATDFPPDAVDVLTDVLGEEARDG